MATLNAPEPSPAESDEQTTAQLVARFHKHVDAINRANAGRLDLSARMRWWHMACARGIHKLLADRACAGDDEAGNVALGAPHFLTYQPSHMSALAAGINRVA